MKKKLFIGLALAVISLMPTQKVFGQFNWPYHIENGTIKTEVPKREAGQQHALGLTVPKMDVVRVAFVGLGMRGPGAVERWTHIPGTQVVALCD